MVFSMRLIKRVSMFLMMIIVVNHHQTFGMGAALKKGATSLMRSGASLFKRGAQQVSLESLSQQSLTEAVETLVKGRVPKAFESPLKKFISGPVVDRATVQVFERDLATKMETPGTSFLQFFQKNAKNKELALSEDLLKDLRLAGKASNPEKKTLAVVKKLLNTPEGKIKLDTSLNLFKESRVGKKMWPDFEESLRESIETTLQKLEVDIVALPKDFWGQGRISTIPYGDKIALKLEKAVFKDLNIPRDILAKELKGITPPSLIGSEGVAAYGSPLYPATESGKLVTKTVPAGIPGQPSRAVLKGTSERQLAQDPAVTGALVARGSMSDDTQADSSEPVVVSSDSLLSVVSREPVIIPKEESLSTMPTEKGEQLVTTPVQVVQKDQPQAESSFVNKIIENIQYQAKAGMESFQKNIAERAAKVAALKKNNPLLKVKKTSESSAEKSMRKESARLAIIAHVRAEEPVEKSLVAEWMKYGGPSWKLAVSPTAKLKEEKKQQALELFDVYNKLLNLQGKDSYAKEGLDRLTLTLFTVLGENDDKAGIQERFKESIDLYEKSLGETISDENKQQIAVWREFIK